MARLPQELHDIFARAERKTKAMDAHSAFKFEDGMQAASQTVAEIQRRLMTAALKGEMSNENCHQIRSCLRSMLTKVDELALITEQHGSPEE